MIVWALLKALLTTNARSWKRIVVHSASYGIAGSLNRRQTRAIIVSTRAGYEAFMRQAKMEPVVEEIGEDARLLWIGHRRTDRVLLYFHGTFGEALSLHAPFSLSDWE